jgi:hypothetical protein
MTKYLLWIALQPLSVVMRKRAARSVSKRRLPACSGRMVRCAHCGVNQLMSESLLVASAITVAPPIGEVEADGG